MFCSGNLHFVLLLQGTGELAAAPKSLFDGTGLVPLLIHHFICFMFICVDDMLVFFASLRLQPTFAGMQYEYKPDLGQVPVYVTRHVSSHCVRLRCII